MTFDTRVIFSRKDAAQRKQQMNNSLATQLSNKRASTMDSEEVKEMIEPTLFRLTEGLPNRELKIIVTQAQECQDALEKEIQLLKAALQDETKLSSENQEAVNQMIASEFTPPDKCFTVSALLGRLREPIDTPLPFNTTIVRHEPPPAKKKRTDTPTPQEEQSKLLKALLELNKSEEYRREHKDSASLLALWKRISIHRTAAVFRKAVNAKEAPGYNERIRFPIDLGLIRKMIIARVIVSFAHLHQRIGLISHNCVKFNGRYDCLLLVCLYKYIIVIHCLQSILTRYILYCTGKAIMQ